MYIYFITLEISKLGFNIPKIIAMCATTRNIPTKIACDFSLPVSSFFRPITPTSSNNKPKKCEDFMEITTKQICFVLFIFFWKVHGKYRFFVKLA